MAASGITPASTSCVLVFPPCSLPIEHGQKRRTSCPKPMQSVPGFLWRASSYSRLFTKRKWHKRLLDRVRGKSHWWRAVLHVEYNLRSVKDWWGDGGEQQPAASGKWVHLCIATLEDKSNDFQKYFCWETHGIQLLCCAAGGRRLRKLFFFFLSDPGRKWMDVLCWSQTRKQHCCSTKLN